MASRYDTWQGTAPIQLPLEVYAKSAAVNEERTAQAVKEIGDTYSAYQSITPYGANAKAAYTETMDKLKATVGDIAKMDLKSPDAKRKIQQAMSDRSIINPLKGIMKHSQDAIARKAEVDEYLKKNPEVNAVNYLEAFNKVGKQKGNAADFDANEFGDLGVLGEYVDIRKRVEDSVKGIMKSEDEQKRILGDKYIETKLAGRLLPAVRNAVRSLMTKDPLVKQQLQKNLKYQYYQANPYDLEDGGSKVAEGNRAQLAEVFAKGNAQLAKKQDIAAKEKNPIKKGAMMAQIERDAELMTNFSNRYKADDPDYNNLNYNIMLDGELNGYDYLANIEKGYKESYTPMAIAQYNAAQANARAAKKASLMKELFNPEIPPLTTFDKREQAAVTDGSLKTSVSGLTELSEVAKLVDDKGAIVSKNYGNDYALQYFKDPSGKKLYVDPKDTYFRPEGSSEPVPAGYVKKGTGYANEKKSGSQYFDTGGGRAPYKGDVYVKVGGTLHTQDNPASRDQSGKEVYKKAVVQVSNAIKALGKDPADYNNFATEADVRTATMEYVNYKNNSKSIYAPMYELPSGQSERARLSLMSDLPTSGVTDANGKEITDEVEIIKLQNFLKEKQNIKYQPFTYFGATDKNQNKNLSFYSFAGPDGKMYKSPMPYEFQRELAGVRHVGKQFIESKGKPVIVGQDLMVSTMGPGGMPTGNAILRGNSVAYQTEAAKRFDENVNTLKAAGLTAVQAKEKLNNEFAKASDHTKNTGEAYPMKVNGKVIYITLPVRETEGKYYSFGRILPDQPKIMDNGQYITESMRKFSSPQTNPFMRNHELDMFKNKQIMGMMFGGEESQVDDMFDE